MVAQREPFEIIGSSPILRIESVEKALAFYVDYLGFELDWLNQIDESSPAYLQVSREGCVLHLSQHPDDAGMAATVFVRCRGIRALALELVAKDTQAFGKPVIKRSHYRSEKFTLTDPFGNRLRFDESDDDWRGPA